MSWSVSATGKPKAVAEKLAADIAQIKCSEPEETIKNKAGEIIAAALGGIADNKAVTVSASGSQQSDNGVPVAQSVNLQITTIYGFLE